MEDSAMAPEQSQVRADTMEADAFRRFRQLQGLAALLEEVAKRDDARKRLDLALRYQPDALIGRADTPDTGRGTDGLSL